MKSSLIRTIIAFLLLLVPSGRFASAQPFAQPPIQADVLSRNVPADGEDRSAYSCDVKSRPYVWFDEQRNRAVAFRMYYPAVPKSRCPIILFSHGLGGSSSSCSYLGTRWAQAGCVSIHLRHVGSDESVWKGKLRIFRELRLAYARSWSGRDQAEDMRFVLDRLESLTASDPVLTTLLNLDRVGLAGYNLGSLAALMLAGQIPPDGGPSLYDPRIKAVVAMGPPVHPSRLGQGGVYSEIDVPCLFINGTEDDSRVGSTTAGQRRIPFDSITKNAQFLVRLPGADHMSYAGHVLPRRAAADARNHAAISMASTAFWISYLHDDKEMRLQWTAADRRPPVGSFVRFERKILPTNETAFPVPEMLHSDQPIDFPYHEYQEGMLYESTVREEYPTPQRPIRTSIPQQPDRRRRLGRGRA